MSKALTSSNQPQVAAQDGPWGLNALVLLAASFAVFGICRSSRLWLGPWLMAVPTVLGLLATLFIVAALIVSGEFTSSLVSVVLLIVWLVAAGFATVGKIFDAAPPARRKTWRHGLPLLFVYAMHRPGADRGRPLAVRPGPARRRRPPAGQSGRAPARRTLDPQHRTRSICAA